MAGGLLTQELFQEFSQQKLSLNLIENKCHYLVCNFFASVIIKQTLTGIHRIAGL